ncbi:MAG: hypothetical protein ACFNYN_07150 [Peptidiphaga gingivicola]
MGVVKHGAVERTGQRPRQGEHDDVDPLVERQTLDFFHQRLAEENSRLIANLHGGMETAAGGKPIYAETWEHKNESEARCHFDAK